MCAATSVGFEPNFEDKVARVVHLTLFTSGPRVAFKGMAPFKWGGLLGKGMLKHQGGQQNKDVSTAAAQL